MVTMSGNVNSEPVSKPGIKDVAERAGVAISSVSRVLSGHPDVSAAMRDAVTNAVRELGYRPNSLARGLRSQRSMSVGFSVADIANPIFADIVGGAERELRSAGYSMILTNAEGNPNLDAGNIALLEDRQVDGLLLSLTQEDHPEVARALKSSTLPIVLLDRDCPEGVLALRAVFDHRSGMTEATNHLLDLGHRDFGIIAGGPALPARDRQQAIEETLWARGGRSTTVEGSFGVEGGYRGAMALLQREPRPTAVIAAGNTLMAGALRAIHELGLEVGRDVSFVGCDNVLIAELHHPPIAVVYRDATRLGQEGAKLLLQALAAEDPKHLMLDDVVLPSHFMARPSCSAPPS
jgi:LacI family transcriptional regulator